MNYTQIQPPEYLKSYVRYFWLTEDSDITDGSKIFRPITDGCPGIIWQRSGEPSLSDQHQKQLPALFLYGQTIQHRELHLNGNFNAIGVCLYPSSLKSVFGFDAYELTDTCTDLNSLAKPLDSCLSERLLSTPSTAQLIEILSTYLLQQVVKNNARPDVLAEQALQKIVQAEGNVPIYELQEQLNVSERNLERRFKQWVGVSPKLFSRIRRFQASLNQLRNSSYEKLSDIAFENGYADQSHFIRVFREFTGFSPHQYRKQADGVVDNLAEWNL